jgi:hypothetical protein
MDRRTPDPLDDAPERPVRDLIVERVRTRPADQRLSVIAGLVATLVLLAVIKPWGSGSPSPSYRPRLPTPAVTQRAPQATDDSAEGLAAPICLGTGGWRVASLETWRTQNVRVWRAIDPVAAVSGPLDPTIPSVPIVAVELDALGYCAPSFGPDKAVGPATVEAWTVTGSEVVAVRLQQVRPPRGSTPLGGLYLPVELCATPPACRSPISREVPLAWETGLVVFHWHDAGTGRDAWFAADVTILAPVEAQRPEGQVIIR